MQTRREKATEAARYDAWYATPRGRWIGESEFRLLARMLGATRGSTLLDVGCGTGWFTRRFHAAGIAVTGLDRSGGSLEFASRRSPGAIRYVQGDACRLPFRDRGFDHAIAVTSLCFVDDWTRAVAELVRVSRRGFAVGLLNRRSLLWRDKGRGGGSGAYAGARWDEADTVLRALRPLALEAVDVRTAVYLPSGSSLARVAERIIPDRVPWGAFLAVAATVAKGGAAAG